ncbi:hypothetical protein [Micromonospora deserti]|uniref:DUF2868 domain-containing protein n=1 Tax=Micromonospora deserti TaxID=2070366 RepID=A0A2W2DXU7_9ACTN|nr:hypothetical protein [Micromonospora deserti]PZG02017.1 hypothetical protein C1I99_04255 [Micromonospora deserti]
MFVVSVVRCGSFQWVAHRQARVLDDAAWFDADVRPVHALPHGRRVSIMRPTGRVDIPVPFVQVVARRGPYLVQVSVATTTAALPADAATAEALAVGQSTVIDGDFGAGVHLLELRTLVARTAWAYALVLLGLYLLANVVAGVRAARRRLRAATPAPRDGDLRWTDVTGRARYLSGVTRARFWLVIVAWACAGLIPGPVAVRVAVSGVATIWFVLNRWHTPASRQLWGRHAERQVWTGRNRGAAGAYSALAAILLVVGIVSLIAPAVLLALATTEYVGPDWRWNPAVMADHFHLWRLVPPALLAVDLLVVSAAILQLGVVFHAKARRRAVLDAPGKLAADGRPPILFLRNFSDDDVTIRTSPLTRKAIVDKLGLRQFERFEEILVRYLSVYGPVIAINNPMKRAPLGAARQTLPMESWHETVSDYVGSSAMIVVAAAPDQVTEGLAWELAQLSALGAVSRTLFVIPPYPREELTARWARFRQMSGNISIPGSVDDKLDRLLVLADGEDRWHGYHAARRTDWAYAVAIAGAAEHVARRKGGVASGSAQ